MRRHMGIFLAAALAFTAAVAPTALATDTMIEDFSMQPETRWRFFTDQVMGGVSTGQVTFPSEADQKYARMTGNVSA